MPNQDRAMCLEACHYKDLSKYCKVFNLNSLEYFLWIYLNPEDVRDTYFRGSVEMDPNSNYERLLKGVYQRESQCWLKVNTHLINRSPGKHTVRFIFVDRRTGLDFSLYVSYYMQVDNPEKPYVYMKDSEENKVEYNRLLPSERYNGFTLYEG